MCLGWLAFDYVLFTILLFFFQITYDKKEKSYW